MIAVDTSVWIDFFRGRPNATEKLSALLDRDEVVLPISVRIEILSGAKRSERSRLERVLAALPVLYPTEASWKRIENWVVVGASAGQRFGVGDLLVVLELTVLIRIGRTILNPKEKDLPSHLIWNVRRATLTRQQFASQYFLFRIYIQLNAHRRRRYSCSIQYQGNSMTEAAQKEANLKYDFVLTCAHDPAGIHRA